MRQRNLKFFIFLALTCVPAYALAVDPAPSAIGTALRASNATVEDSALRPQGVIFSGEAIHVRDGGSAVLSFPHRGEAILAASTNARFSNTGGSLTAQLLSGTLIVSRQTKETFAVKTPAYKIEPHGEGRTEFLVASLPGDKTIIEAEHGDLAITDSGSGASYTLAQGLRAEIRASAEGLPGQGKGAPTMAVGQVNSSMESTRNGKPLSEKDWVLNGDTVSTAANGQTAIRLWPANMVTLDGETTATFTRPAERIWLKLERGKVTSESASADSVLILTPRFHVEPAAGGSAKILVAVMPDGSTLIQSLLGDVSITESHSERSYLLPSGQKRLIPANASGIPGLASLGPTPAPPTPTASAPTPPPPGVNKHSHNTYLILGLAGGGGAAAAAAAALAGGGGGNSSSGGGSTVTPPPTSPVTP